MSDTPATAVPDERGGIALAISAYVIWGVMPIYWHQLSSVSPFQVTAYRILFCALFVGALTLARGRLSRIVSIATTPAILRNLLLTAALIACNWTTFVYSVASNQILESSLGYYILPLISIALGVLLFGERMSRVRLLALALAAMAVAVQTIALGQLPWIALVLAFSFGFYGYFRKLTPVDPFDGLLIETLILLPIVGGLVLYWTLSGQAALTGVDSAQDLLLIGAGPFTAIPLGLFAGGARRIRMSTLGFLQYLAPSISLVIAVALFGEPFTLTQGITFACVWSAIAIVAAEGQMSRWRLRSLAGK